jgi:hypothetical protein
MRVWAVMEDGEGAHEPEAVMSLWTTLDGAAAEVARLNERHAEFYQYERKAYYLRTEPIEVDTPGELDRPLT